MGGKQRALSAARRTPDGSLGRRCAVALTVIVSLLALSSGGVGAQPEGVGDSTTTTVPDSTTTTVDAGLPPVMANLPPATPGPPPAVDRSPPPQLPRPSQTATRAAEAAVRRARQELAAAERELKAARGREAETAERHQAFEAEAAAAEERLAALSDEEQTTADRLVTAKGRVRNLAVGQYMNGGNVGVSLQYLLNADDPEDLVRRGALLSHASEVQRSAADVYRRANQAVADRIRADLRWRDETVSKRDVAAAELQAAGDQVRALSAEVDGRRLLLDTATAGAPVPPSDIPRLFLDAYQRAAQALQREQPRCRVGWTAIAAIGKIESDHGRFRGAQVTLGGNPLPPIVGIRLDGADSAVITDSDGGLLDGDLEFDRAVGPMQFIPSSWKAIARDANGDGNTDVHNAYDAALGTASYLCRAMPGGRLDLDEGLRPAFFSYNHSNEYVESVLGWHRTYAALAPSMPTPPGPDRVNRSGRGRR